MRRIRYAQRATGFTLVESLIVMVFIAALIALGMPALQEMIHRSRLEGVARETGVLCQATRLEAIKSGAPAGLRLEPASLRMYSWIDINADGKLDEGEQQLADRTLPGTVAFGAPDGEGDPIEGFDSDDDGYWITFNTDGSINATGDIRFSDSRANYLQLSLSPAATATVELRKWDGSEWMLSGEEGKPWEWN